MRHADQRVAGIAKPVPPSRRRCRHSRCPSTSSGTPEGSSPTQPLRHRRAATADSGPRCRRSPVSGRSTRLPYPRRRRRWRRLAGPPRDRARSARSAPPAAFPGLRRAEPFGHSRARSRRAARPSRRTNGCPRTHRPRAARPRPDMKLSRGCREMALAGAIVAGGLMVWHRYAHGASGSTRPDQMSAGPSMIRPSAVKHRRGRLPDARSDRERRRRRRRSMRTFSAAGTASPSGTRRAR